MRTEIKALHQALKTTIVYVTHDQIEAMTMADRIVVMNQGRIEQVGAPLELYDRPGNKFVAGFLGSPAMSFIPGVLERGDGPARVRIAGDATVAVGETAARSGQAVEIGVRPEHYRIAPAGEGVPYRVEVVEPTGAETHLFGSIAGLEVRCVFRERLAPEPGSVLHLTAAPEHVHVFDAESGVRA
jgi:multiple sugar transport system ATP-binding protein